MTCIARFLCPLVPLLLLFGSGLMIPPAAAQQGSVEERLREMLRRTTIELRSAQDAQTTLQAALDEAQKQRDVLRQQVEQLSTQLATAPQVTAPASAPDQAELDRLRTALETARRQAASLQDGLSHWQQAYQDAAALAQTRDAQSRRLDAATDAAQRTLAMCRDRNTRLIALSDEILHLYQSQSFRSLLLGSYEPLLGLKRVELETLVQDYEDKIRAHTDYPTAASAPKTPAAPAGAPGR